jgi:AraC-like DNA-binding protein
MLNQSSSLLDATYAPIRLDENFPVSEPDHTLRKDIPIEAHVHDCFEIGYCISGSGIFIVENKILPFRAGDAVVINHRELHTMKGGSGNVADWYFVNLSPAALLAALVREDTGILETESLSGHDFNNVLSSLRYPDICANIREIVREMREKAAGYQSVVRSLVWGLMIKLHRIRPKTAGNKLYAPAPASRRKLEIVAPAIRWIIQHYHEDISMDTLARKCNYSISNFRKVFHAATGYSPQEYIKRLRLEAVASMLRNTEEDILYIAVKSGYVTLSNFNRQFKAFFKLSPRQWREAQKNL